MDDLISRQAAIEAVNNAIADYAPYLIGRYEAIPLEMAMAIKQIPTEARKVVTMNLDVSAEDFKKAIESGSMTLAPPERKKGKWAPDDYCSYGRVKHG